MSYVETCSKHGQYHADYICGGCYQEYESETKHLKEEG